MSLHRPSCDDHPSIWFRGMRAYIGNCICRLFQKAPPHLPHPRTQTTDSAEETVPNCMRPTRREGKVASRCFTCNRVLYEHHMACHVPQKTTLLAGIILLSFWFFNQIHVNLFSEAAFSHQQSFLSHVESVFPVRNFPCKSQDIGRIFDPKNVILSCFERMQSF